MFYKRTEQMHDAAQGIDKLPLQQVAAILAEGQVAAAQAVHGALDAIAEGAFTIANALRNGGTLHYVAAGSSGLMAAADAQELGGTFSIPAENLRIHMAGGLPTGVEMPGHTEDQTSDLTTTLQSLTHTDVIIAVSASGTTPYTVVACEIAAARGAKIVAIANNPGTPLLTMADCPILLETPPEVLSGSTRMGAGTAQKIALNMLSTLMAFELGHVYDGMMVNLRADNIKLRQRACSIIQRAADVPEDTAHSALDAAEGNVKVAVLMAKKDVSLEKARALLSENGGHLRPALEQNH